MKLLVFIYLFSFAYAQVLDDKCGGVKAGFSCEEGLSSIKEQDLRMERTDLSKDVKEFCDDLNTKANSKKDKVKEKYQSQKGGLTTPDSLAEIGKKEKQDLDSILHPETDSKDQILSNLCSGSPIDYQELKRLSNDAKSYLIVLKGLKEIKSDLEERQLDFALERNEKAQQLKDKFEAFDEKLAEVETLEDSFNQDFTFYGKDGKVNKGSPYLAYLTYFNINEDEDTNKKIKSDYRGFDSFIRNTFCSKDKPSYSANAKRPFCKSYSKYKQPAGVGNDDPKEALKNNPTWDFFVTRYQVKKNRPSDKDLDFAKNKTEAKAYLDEMKKSLKMRKNGSYKTIADYKKDVNYDELKSTMTNLSAKDLRNKDKLEKVLNLQKEQMDYTRAYPKVDLEKLKQNLGNHYIANSKNNKSAVESINDNTHEVMKMADEYSNMRKLTDDYFKNREPEFNEKLVADFRDRFERFQKSSLANNRKLTEEQKYNKQAFQKVKEDILTKNKTCFDGFTGGDAYKDPNALGECLLGKENFQAEPTDAIVAFRRAAARADQIQKLILKVEDKRLSSMREVKDDMVMCYFKKCPHRFEVEYNTFQMKTCLNGSDDILINSEGIVIDYLEETVQDNMNILTHINKEVLDKLRAEAAEKELTIATDTDKEEVSIGESDTDELDETVRTSDTSNDYYYEDTTSDEDERNAYQEPEIYNFDEIFGQQEEYKPNFWDYFSVGVLGTGQQMMPEVMRYRQNQFMISQAYAQTAQRRSLMMNAYGGGYPYYYPRYQNSYLSDYNYQSGSYFRGANSPLYMYDSSYSDILYSNQGGGIRGSGTLNSPVQWVDSSPVFRPSRNYTLWRR